MKLNRVRWERDKLFSFDLIQTWSDYLAKVINKQMHYDFRMQTP